ncbi:MAG: ABC transporter permease [Mucilaginibacter sp.]
MIRNYLKIAWRNIIKQKLFSLINITGLATGLSVCMMIMLYVAHEMSYDRFHKNASRIFIPNASIKINGNNLNMDYTSYTTGPYVKDNEPAVEDYSRAFSYHNTTVVSVPTAPEAKFAENNLLFADPNFFTFFSFPLLSGQPEHLLDRPFTVVLSKDMARKYFGGENPVGKSIVIKTDSAYTYQVTGVAQNTPSNSTITFNFIASNTSLVRMKNNKEYLGDQPFTNGSFTTYLLLKNTSDTAKLSRDMDVLIKKQEKGTPFADMRIIFTSLVSQHLDGNFGDTSNLKYLKIFPLVALLILVLALVNYMSLSTAKATLRAKEVGVRKVSGASRGSLAAQFYTESALYAVLSFVLGYILCYTLKPWFLNILQLNIDNSFLYSPLILLLLFGLLVLTILIAGSYPSVVLSGFNPVITLKGKFGKKAGGVTVRKIFTTLQFTISVSLIICGIVIDRQLYFFRHADTGIDKDNVVMIPVTGTMGKNYTVFKAQVQSLAGVGNTTTSHYGMFSGYDMYDIAGRDANDHTMLPAMAVGENFVKTLGLKWKIPPVNGDALRGKNKVILNELAAEKLHLLPNAVGATLKSGQNTIVVAGVLKNFNYTSMEYAQAPIGLFIAPDSSSFWSRVGCNLFVKIKPHINLPTLLANIQSIYKKYDQETPFTYTFMDDAFNAQYKAEDRLASIFSIFTVITIMIAALGLFGLAAFTIEQRTKEIGIRKVLGASVASINQLLSKDFLKLVLLSVVIASPIAWLLMHSWLEKFAYRITISWWMFAVAGITAIAISVITISYHAIRAAVTNPVESLRSE